MKSLPKVAMRILRSWRATRQSLTLQEAEFLNSRKSLRKKTVEEICSPRTILSLRRSSFQHFLGRRKKIKEKIMREV